MTEIRTETVSSEAVRGLSERLRTFVAEMPYERGPIFDFVKQAARSMAKGARVLDVGAGDAPYAELFEHVEYVTTDWEASVHEGARMADVIAPADRLPLPDAGLDAVICTQVLEHVPNPQDVLAELHRVLRPGGRIFLTVPLVWELHELPHDYFRYTQPGLEHLLDAAGFAEVSVEPRGDCFATVAQLLLNIGAAMGRAPDGLDDSREAAASVLTDLSAHIGALSPLDARRVLPLGYQATATRAA